MKIKTEDVLYNEPDFNLLSLHDLLKARQQFHLHLVHKPNVVATAIGRYRIRKSDPWPHENEEQNSKSYIHSIRTLENSEVRPYSWPAILVFVDKWVNLEDFSHPEEVVPPAVYMPNGQKVPLCVIVVNKDEMLNEADLPIRYPTNYMGGGYPVYTSIQGRQHFASVACLVSNGHKVYALTNRHVAGEADSIVSAFIGNQLQPIGRSSPLSLSRKLFEQVYPGWPGKNMYVDLDVGLIDIDDLHHWTTQVYGIGEIGPLADIDTSNLSLKLIGCPVIAHGAASGVMHGEICALFYRFKSVGGFDYIADVLIGPREHKPLGTNPGDSGTLWLIDNTNQTDKLSRPLALQWGGQEFLEGNKKSSSYVLATFLSTICNELDVTLLRDWNIGLPNYWGAVGHYSIATKACDVVQNTKLKKLMSANLERISYAVPDINRKNLTGLSKRDFVPLADVPDLVWKIGRFKRGGPASPEHANHFADMDRILNPPLPEGRTLLEICENNPENISVPIWQRYYDAVQAQFPEEEESRGLLPFRVWQIYDTMVAAVRAGNVAEFVCAAGILSHYVGDSCQPLHISYLYNGDPDNPVPGIKRDRITGKKSHGYVPAGHGVHSAYEDNMISRHVPELFHGIDLYLANREVPSFVRGGQSAAFAVVELMQNAIKTLPPTNILNEFLRWQDETPAPRADAMWEALGEDTTTVIAEGCVCLAQLWDSAWREGNGDQTITSLDTIDEETLSALYQDPDFLPSHRLDTIQTILSKPRTARTRRAREPETET